MADLIPPTASELPGTVSQSSPLKDNTGGNSREKKIPSRASRQRFKPQLSCTFCRTRKLKCDRNSPCNNCSKRDLSSSCTYIHNSREKISNTQRIREKPKDVQDRIQHLEELVVTLMNQAKDTTAPSEPDILPGFQSSTIKPRELSWPNDATVSESVDSIGRISVQDERQNYVGESHWAAILENIAGLKDSLGSEEWPHGTSRGKNTYKGPELLLGDNRTASRESILACLPSEALVNNLVDRYFTAIDACFITHAPTFRKEYAEFWDNPDSKSISWIGLLFSIICLAANFELRTGDAPIAALSNSAIRDTEQRIRIYREKTVQCLVNSNYTEPGLYTVETLLLYHISEHFQTKDTIFGSWMVLGMIIRAGMRLGMHRDASHYPSISIFRGEMQRRVWGAILLVDIQTSCQVGLPRMVSEGMYDTKPASHLLDEDLFEDMVVLPPARLEYESSLEGYALFKHRLLLVFGKIFDASNLVTPIHYDEVMRLEKLLFDALGEIPEFFRARSIHDLERGSPMLRVRRFSIEMTYLKARCFLHRKFLSEAESLQKHSYSVKACVDSSMLILQYQDYLTNEIAQGCSLQSMKWITSSLMTYDFLLAATLLCLYLGQLVAAEEKSVDTSLREFPIDWTIRDILHALSKSYQIWNNPDNSSEDTMKFSKVLKAMLRKVDHWSTVNETQDEVASEMTSEPNSNTSLAEHREILSASIAHERRLPIYSASNTYALQLSNFEESPSDSPTSNIGMIGNILNDPTGLDWSLWDSNFQGSSNFIDASAPLYSSDPYFPFQAAGFESNLDGS
ncbi:putative fungal specific transcription protein [Botrytis cinerea BcDW1]|uniref:Putative fungal specific transcription protein n=1 Tax=Botryotinia fuckeliana (strain BcDW1) TaxID=1290391 RepID=M7V1S4_BOTF1|nr:putative fungal specific transcription protein [Botrytis cinerea BcDW1]